MLDEIKLFSIGQVVEKTKHLDLFNGVTVYTRLDIIVGTIGF